MQTGGIGKSWIVSAERSPAKHASQSHFSFRSWQAFTEAGSNESLVANRARGRESCGVLNLAFSFFFLFIFVRSEYFFRKMVGPETNATWSHLREKASQARCFFYTCCLQCFCQKSSRQKAPIRLRTVPTGCSQVCAFHSPSGILLSLTCGTIVFG
ncbi:hypothetical protein CPB84DRAFT_148340 [Gymnopilus junonius]|uniref:Uncharacterized protein n=1 Tax=Gymnopilus junonius TaxID=109634 RepID=A0A9P5NFP3_GYMJU|nr:hypothetical protein CPB84DRAFT_148340 [Gymnopilus junonius]